jgi:hypothetical protein
MPVIIMDGGLFGCFVCECEAVLLALSLFSVDLHLNLNSFFTYDKD